MKTKAQSLILFILLLLLSACSPFVIAGSSGVPPMPDIELLLATQGLVVTPGQIDFEGISFVLDPEVAANPIGSSIPENPGSPDGPYWEVHPGYISISFYVYPVHGSLFKPVISVLPVDDYRRLSSLAGETIDQLQDFLAQKPADVHQIPSLPVMNYEQDFHSNLKYLEFQNGVGVRFLARYSQAADPVTNQDLVYVFQGLTDDGQNAVSIFLPANHPTLPVDPNALTPEEVEVMYQDFGKYQMDTANFLSVQPANGFTPNLEKLDALVASLKVEPYSGLSTKAALICANQQVNAALIKK